MRTSNAGQCLFTGIASPERARRVARTLLGPESFSGWGIRTVAASEARYNPMGYHNGSVWPHDNALIAQGLARYGLGELALQIWTGLFEAGRYFDLHRMPELFCGFPKVPGRGLPCTRSPAPRRPGRPPRSSSSFRPAWVWRSTAPRRKSASPGRTCRRRWANCGFTTWRWPGRRVDLLLVRHEQDVGVNVLRREGDVQILVVK